MQTAIQLIVTSLQIGAVYILFSLGLTLIFGVMRIVNFAHGHLFTISALMVAYSVPWLAGNGFPVLLAYLTGAAIGIAVALVIGFLIYVFGFRYFQRDMVGSFILSIGLVLLLDGVLLKLFGGAVRPVPEVLSGTVNILGATVTTQRLALCFAAVVITGMLYLALTRTRLGKALRADAEAGEILRPGGDHAPGLVALGDRRRGKSRSRSCAGTGQACLLQK